MPIKVPILLINWLIMSVSISVSVNYFPAPLHPLRLVQLSLHVKNVIFFLQRSTVG